MPRHDAPINLDARCTQEAIPALVSFAELMARSTPNAMSSKALLHVADELLGKRCDWVLDGATLQSTSVEAAQLLRHASEQASERIARSEHGRTTATRSLFAIPFLFDLSDTVGESPFDAFLQNIDWLHVRALCDRRVVLVKHWLHVADFLGAPLSTIKQCAMAIESEPAISSHTNARGLRASPFPQEVRRPRLGKSYVRYLVGTQPLNDDGSDPRARELNVSKLQDYLAEVLTRAGISYNGIGALYNGTFHDAFYIGMWRYQNLRLSQLASQLAAEHRQVQAEVRTQGNRLRLTPQVSFLTQGRPLTAYALSARPVENFDRCASRIRETLTQSGIGETKHVVDVNRSRTAAYQALLQPI